MNLHWTLIELRAIVVSLFNYIEDCLCFISYLHVYHSCGFFSGRPAEKNLRGLLRSEVDRSVSKDSIVIVDSLNNIKVTIIDVFYHELEPNFKQVSWMEELSFNIKGVQIGLDKRYRLALWYKIQHSYTNNQNLSQPHFSFVFNYIWS